MIFILIIVDINSTSVASDINRKLTFPLTEKKVMVCTFLRHWIYQKLPVHMNHNGSTLGSTLILPEFRNLIQLLKCECSATGEVSECQRQPHRDGRYDLIFRIHPAGVKD